METTRPEFATPKAGSLQAGAISQEALPLEIAHGTDDPTRVLNFKRTVPASSSAADRTRFVKAADTGALALDEESAHAIARALVDPRLGTRMIQAPAYLEEVVETATLRSIQGEVFSTELFPLMQPRTAGSALAIPDPEVSGELDDDGRPLATLKLTFKDLEHLTKYMRQTVRETRRSGKRYDESILARRVSRPLFVHTAIVVLEDSGDEIDVLVVRDGITRLVSSYAARLSAAPSSEDIADEIVRTLLSPKPARAGAKSTVTQDYARGREAARASLRSEFESGLAGGQVAESAIRIGQTFTLPSTVYVDIIPESNSPLPPSAQFDEAIRSVVSSIHVEFRPWDETSERVEVGDRALHRIGHSNELDEGVVDLAVGDVGLDAMATIFNRDDIPATALWRAIYIVAWMCHPVSFKAMKRELRSILGLGRIEDKSYVSHLAPLVDRPWRLTKSTSLSQARSAWANGGPIPKGALGADWEPVPVKDFLELVPLALEGDRDARLTLQIGGGIALITDKLLTSNKGSKIGSGVVPFRSDVDDVISNLGASEHGLRILARAANAFDANRLAINSLTETELKDQSLAAKRTTAYRVPKVDANDLTRLVLDNAGTPELLTEYEVVTVSSPDRAHAEAEATRQKAKSGTKTTETEVQRAQRLRRDVKSGASQLHDNIRDLITLAANSDGSVGSAFENQEAWAAISDAVQEIGYLLHGAKPKPAEATPIDDDDDDDDEDDE